MAPSKSRSCRAARTASASRRAWATRSGACAATGAAASSATTTRNLAIDVDSLGAQLAQAQAELVEAEMHLPGRAPRPQQLLGHSIEVAIGGLEQRPQVLALDVGRD